MPISPYQNTLLQNMEPETLNRLALRRIELPLRRILQAPGQLISHIYFVEQGIGSMTTAFENGTQVETSMFGYESAVGISALMGVKRALNPVFMQLPGYGFSSPVEAARDEFRRNGKFQFLALRYVQAQLTLAMQNAACNAMHTYEQRLARWLLICCDRAKSTRIEMAQEFVSEMLGSTRSTISIAATRLKAKGLIDYHRGSIQVLDPVRLEEHACECYRVVRNHLENIAEFDTDFVV